MTTWTPNPDKTWTPVRDRSPAGSEVPPSGGVLGVSPRWAREDHSHAAGAVSRSTTVTVAASNALQSSKDEADFVCTGSDDQTTWHLARNAIATIGGTILLSEGDFYLSARFELPATGVLYDGITLAGQGSSTKVHPDVNADFTDIGLVVVGADNNRLTNFYIDGRDSTGSDNFGAALVYLDSSVATTIDAIHFDRTNEQAVYGDDVTWTKITNCWFEDQVSDGGVFFAIDFGGTVTDHVLIVANQVFTSGGALRLDGNPLECVIEGNVFRGDVTIGDATDLVLVGNLIVGLLLMDSGGGLSNNIAGNWVDTLDFVSFCEDLTVVGNRFIALGTIAGALLTFNDNVVMTEGGVFQIGDGSVSGNSWMTNEGLGDHIVIFDGCEHLSVHSNTIIPNIYDGAGTDNTYDGIHIRADTNECDFQLNTIRGLRGPTARLRHAIRVDNANCDNNVVTNNNMRSGGATTAGLSDAGTGTITTAGNH